MTTTETEQIQKEVAQHVLAMVLEEFRRHTKADGTIEHTFAADAVERAGRVYGIPAEDQIRLMT